VGAVIVKNGKIIGVGYHEYFGGPHAEINAINNVKEDLEGAELYVNLEP
jgi:diaminohydroxyphosphoribosylaminopyrimidine deaminase/5-amino-6-(5-phosphoribosylamino)uracil reductase